MTSTRRTIIDIAIMFIVFLWSGFKNPIQVDMV